MRWHPWIGCPLRHGSHGSHGSLLEEPLAPESSPKAKLPDGGLQPRIDWSCFSPIDRPRWKTTFGVLQSCSLRRCSVASTRRLRRIPARLAPTLAVDPCSSVCICINQRTCCCAMPGSHHVMHKPTRGTYHSVLLFWNMIARRATGTSRAKVDSLFFCLALRVSMRLTQNPLVSCKMSCSSETPCPRPFIRPRLPNLR